MKEVHLFVLTREKMGVLNKFMHNIWNYSLVQARLKTLFNFFLSFLHLLWSQNGPVVGDHQIDKA